METKNQPLINLLVRTHNRPNIFKKCIESLKEQTYDNVFVIVIADNQQSKIYADKALDEGFVDDVILVNPASFKSYITHEQLVKQGLAKRTDKNRSYFNMYFNKVVKEIQEGWIFIFDDDLEFGSKNTLKNLAKKLEDEDSLVVSRHKIGESRLVPDDNYWDKIPFTRGQICNASICFHSKYKDIAVWDGHRGGDYRLALRLAEKLDVIWYKSVTTTAEREGFGKTEEQLKKI
jgi:glycosyltransferase involved in cell wall biosynthesis